MLLFVLCEYSVECYGKEYFDERIDEYINKYITGVRYDTCTLAVSMCDGYVWLYRNNKNNIFII